MLAVTVQTDFFRLMVHHISMDVSDAGWPF